MRKYQVCTNCVMDTTDSAITFDEKGVCDHCNTFYTAILPNWHTDEKGKKGVRIVLLVSKSEPHRESLRDDYNRISARALEEKKTAALERWFLAKIPTFYVMIDGEYRPCHGLAKWQAGSGTAGN